VKIYFKPSLWRWIRVLIYKLIVARPVKNFPHENRTHDLSVGTVKDLAVPAMKYD